MSIQLISDITVTPIQHMGSDAIVAAAAKVSVNPEEALKLAEIEQAEGIKGLINYLMSHRHMSPFEHCVMTFYIHAPIFVFREWHRHRTQAYNEWSARYSALEPVFWVPRRERLVVPVEGFKASRPTFQAASDSQYETLTARLQRAYEVSWNQYDELMTIGIAKEVARSVLPVGVYSKMWATASLRNFFQFISLRTHEPEAKWVSYPQAEIEESARQVESFIAETFPLSYAAFVKNGRAV